MPRDVDYSGTRISTTIFQEAVEKIVPLPLHPSDDG